MRGAGLLVLSLVTVCSAWAFPTQQEIKEAGAVVGDLVKEDIDKANAGKIKHVEAADKISALIEQASSEGAKWLLMKHAFIQYAKGAEYDKAAETMTQILATFPDVLPATALSLIRNNAPRANSTNAAKLMKLRDMLLMRQKCAAVLASPKASKLMKAEATCLSGNWEKGLKMLAQTGGAAGAMAQAELTDPKSIAKVADFWWKYDSKLDTCGAFKSHAAELYQRGLAEGSLDGLYKTMAEKRIAEMNAAPVVMTKDGGIKGLLHRWSFNGNLLDSVTRSKARIDGKAEFKDGAIVLPGGGRNVGAVDLGSGYLPGGKPFTLEIWAGQNRIEYWAEVFRLRYAGDLTPCRFFGFCLYWNVDVWRDTSSFVVPKPRNNAWYAIAGGWDPGVLYHIVVVGSRRTDGALDITYYRAKQNEQDLRQMFYYEGVVWPLNTESLWLGRFFSLPDPTRTDPGEGKPYLISDAAAFYDEVRIWDSALTLERLNAMHKAGPNKIP